ncbi:hypothetical protein TYRP_006519 [Tyrophagus putrescentiae]|nr:hypothetical protein TYRP_006519 [Tyrophagus putrescentiae]
MDHYPGFTVYKGSPADLHKSICIGFKTSASSDGNGDVTVLTDDDALAHNDSVGFHRPSATDYCQVIVIMAM